MHPLDLPVEEEVQQQRLDEVVGVMPEGDLVAPELVRIREGAPAELAQSEQNVSPGDLP